MLYLVTGKEEFLREEFLGQLKALMHKLPMGEHNVDELGPGATLRDVAAACDVVPFLCDKRMIIARGVVSQVGRGRGGRSRRTASGEGSSNPLDEFIAYVPNLPSTTHLVLVEEDAASLQPVLQAKSDAVKRDFPRLREDALPRWITERARKHQARISPRAAAELAQLVGSELRTLDSELAKLATYVDPDAAIEVDDVHQLVAGGGADIFTLHDAVAERRGAAALAAAHSRLEQGDDPSELLAQLAGLIRRLLVVKELTAERRTLAREAPTYGVTSSPYALQKLQRQAARLSATDLERAYASLRDTDLAIKTGRTDPELAIELAIAQITGLASASDPGGLPAASATGPRVGAPR